MADIGADSTAIAWAIAKNKEQENSFQQQKKVYREGVVDGSGGNVTEDGEFTDTGDIFLEDNASIPTDPYDDENVTPGYIIDPFIININGVGNGVYLKYFRTAGDPEDPNDYRYVHFYLDDYYNKASYSVLSTTTVNYRMQKNRPCIDIIDGSSTTTKRSGRYAFECGHCIYENPDLRPYRDFQKLVKGYKIEPKRCRIHFYVKDVDYINPETNFEGIDTYNYLYWDNKNYTYVGAKTNYP